MGRRLQTMATREKISASQKERWRKKRAAEAMIAKIGEGEPAAKVYVGPAFPRMEPLTEADYHAAFTGLVGPSAAEADIIAARKAAEEARDAAKKASESAAKSLSYAAAAIPIGKGTILPSGAVLVGEKPESADPFWRHLNAPILAAETRVAIWLWFLWFMLYLATWFGWLWSKIA